MGNSQHICGHELVCWILHIRDDGVFPSQGNGHTTTQEATLQLLLPITPFRHHPSGPIRGKVTRQSVKHKTFLSMGSVAIYGDRRMRWSSTRRQSWCNTAGACSSYTLRVPWQVHVRGSGLGGLVSKSCTSRREIRVMPSVLCVHVSILLMHFQTSHVPCCDWLIPLLFISDWGEPTWMSSSCQKILGQSQPRRALQGQARALSYSLSSPARGLSWISVRKWS